MSSPFAGEAPPRFGAHTRCESGGPGFKASAALPGGKLFPSGTSSRLNQTTSRQTASNGSSSAVRVMRRGFSFPCGVPLPDCCADIATWPGESFACASCDPAAASGHRFGRCPRAARDRRARSDESRPAALMGFSVVTLRSIELWCRWRQRFRRAGPACRSPHGPHLGPGRFRRDDPFATRALRFPSGRRRHARAGSKMRCGSTSGL